MGLEMYLARNSGYGTAKIPGAPSYYYFYSCRGAEGAETADDFGIRDY